MTSLAAGRGAAVATGGVRLVVIILALAACLAGPKGRGATASACTLDRSHACIAKIVADDVRLCETLLGARDGVAAKGGTVCFSGEILKTTPAVLVPRLAGARTLVVRSMGGYVSAALDIAGAMLDGKLARVVVWRWCLSSCANYLFLAGAQKAVAENAYLGWHGGPINPDADGAIEGDRRTRLKQDYARSEAFFRRLHLSSALLYTPNPLSGVTAKNNRYKMWTYRRADLEKTFGVRGIVYYWYAGSAR